MNIYEFRHPDGAQCLHFVKVSFDLLPSFSLVVLHFTRLKNAVNEGCNFHTWSLIRACCGSHACNPCIASVHFTTLLMFSL